MSHSRTLFHTAEQLIPGGVNSPVRAFKAVGGTPPFIKNAQGAYLFDEDGKRYIDYIGSWGPMILGHNHPEVIKALHTQIDRGLSFGTPTALEANLAAEVIKLMPNIEQIRMVNSGTEATMSAIRLARGFTQRDKLIKFGGCYHGHADSLLVNAGSGALTFGVPSSPGVPEDFAKHTLTADFNDLNQVEDLFKANPNDIACIIIEPFAGNMNFIRPKDGFLQGLRDLCDQYGALLIFDEVMTGFRVALGGAQSIVKIKPDLTCLGKIIGGGLPVGAFGGRKDIMQHLAPVGPVYQAGTLSGNPLAMTAGLATLKAIQADGFYEQLTEKTRYLINGLKQAADQAGIALSIDTEGGMFGFVFSDHSAMHNLNDVQQGNTELFKRFFHQMLDHGIYLAPSAFEAGFVSQAHTMEDLDQTIQAAKNIFSALEC